MEWNLNRRAVALCDRIDGDAGPLGVSVSRSECGARILDFRRGGLEAGRRLAELCLAGLGRVDFVPGNNELWPGPAVQVYSDQPTPACMASQYAGWKLAAGKFFAMGSGAMRAAAGTEAIFDKIGLRERPNVAAGVLETSDPPPDDVCRQVAEACGTNPLALSLAFANTASLSGSVQVVARSLETALHKFFELGGDLSQVVSGYGVAPLAPPARNDLAAIGRTNDAILYGGDVTLWVRGPEEPLVALGEKMPSSASADYGAPFEQIFRQYNGDFYQIDPHLFSPARVTLLHLDTGRGHVFGRLAPEILRASFESA